MARRWMGVCAILALAMGACASAPLSAAPSCDLAPAAAPSSFPISQADYAALADCLGHPDPAVRDKFAYERFVDALRNRPPSVEIRQALAAQLMRDLKPGEADEAGFRAPFAVLVLAEVARTDRIEPWLSPEQRTDMILAGAEYLKSVRDYRGFDEAEGWRHGIAHAADLLLQFALNPALDGSDAEIIFDAVGSQVLPRAEQFYVFGESRRLARPILYLALNEHEPEDGWTAWMSQFGPNEADLAWQDPYGSRQGLAHLHNARQFASAVLITASSSNQPALVPVADAARALLADLP